MPQRSPGVGRCSTCEADGASAPLGCAECRSAEEYVAFPGRPSETFYICRESGLIFQDLSDVQFECEAQNKGRDELTDSDIEQLTRNFGGSVQVSTRDGKIYAAAEYDDQEIINGLLRRIESFIDADGGIDTSQPFSILEVGSGSGFMLNALRKRYPMARVRGIDPSPINCDQARDQYGVDVDVGTLETVDFEQGEFDMIVMFGNLMLHTNPLRTLKLAKDLLRPGGLLLTEVKNPFSSARRIMRAGTSVPVLRKTRLFKKLLKHTYHGMRFGLSKSWVKNALDEVGFELLEITTRPPRLLEFGNRYVYSKGAYGLAWRALDVLDTWQDERAWIQVRCRVPVAEASTRASAE